MVPAEDHRNHLQLTRSSPASRRHHARAGRFRGARGEVSTTLIVFPAVIIAFYCAVHAALVFHGRSVVAAAAQDGLRAAQLEDGTEADGYAAANRTLALSPGLQNTDVDVSQGNDAVSVTVTAQVNTLLIGVFTNVRADVTGPRERFYSEAERR